MDTSLSIRASLHKQVAAERWVSTWLRKNRFRRPRPHELDDGPQGFASSQTLSVFNSLETSPNEIQKFYENEGGAAIGKGGASSTG